MPSRFIGQVYETEQGLFCLHPSDLGVSGAIVNHGKYDKPLLGFLIRYLKSTDKMLLLGAHIGALVVPLSKHLDSMTVLEANPSTYELLKINLHLNGCTNVTALNLAANDQFTNLTFVLNTVNSGGSKRWPETQDPMYFYDNPEIVMVCAVPLDDLLVGKYFDIIFMDIEGSETSAMQGMQILLGQARILVSEFIPHHLKLVAGVTPEQFLSGLSGFGVMYSPAVNRWVSDASIREFIRYLYENDISDGNLIFFRNAAVAQDFHP